MAIPVSYYSETIADNTVKGNGEPETANFSVAITTLTAANLVAETTKINALKTAVAGVIIGVLNKSETVVNRALGISGPAGSPLAQRENKLLVRFYDSVTFKRFSYAIPTVDLPNLVFLSEARDFVDPTTPAAVVALVSAHQAFIVNPETGNLTTIENLEYVGRNV